MNKRKKYFDELKVKVWDIDGRPVMEEKGDLPKLKRALKSLEGKYK